MVWLYSWINSLLTKLHGVACMYENTSCLITCIPYSSNLLPDTQWWICRITAVGLIPFDEDILFHGVTENTAAESIRVCTNIYSSALERAESNFKNSIVSFLLIGIFRSSSDIAIRSWPRDRSDDKLTLVQVMLLTWCRQATSHSLPQPMLTQIYVAILCH